MCTDASPVTNWPCRMYPASPPVSAGTGSSSTPSFPSSSGAQEAATDIMDAWTADSETQQRLNYNVGLRSFPRKNPLAFCPPPGTNMRQGSVFCSGFVLFCFVLHLHYKQIKHQNFFWFHSAAFAAHGRTNPVVFAAALPRMVILGRR